jgi:hypothetical protein
VVLRATSASSGIIGLSLGYFAADSALLAAHPALGSTEMAAHHALALLSLGVALQVRWEGGGGGGAVSGHVRRTGPPARAHNAHTMRARTGWRHARVPAAGAAQRGHDATGCAACVRGCVCVAVFVCVCVAVCVCACGCVWLCVLSCLLAALPCAQRARPPLPPLPRWHVTLVPACLSPRPTFTLQHTHTHTHAHAHAPHPPTSQPALVAGQGRRPPVAPVRGQRPAAAGGVGRGARRAVGAAAAAHGRTLGASWGRRARVCCGTGCVCVCVCGVVASTWLALVMSPPPPPPPTHTHTTTTTTATG